MPLSSWRLSLILKVLFWRSKPFSFKQSIFENDKWCRNLVVLDGFVRVNDNIVLLQPVLNTVIDFFVKDFWGLGCKREGIIDVWRLHPAFLRLKWHRGVMRLHWWLGPVLLFEQVVLAVEVALVPEVDGRKGGSVFVEGAVVVAHDSRLIRSRSLRVLSELRRFGIHLDFAYNFDWGPWPLRVHCVEHRWCLYSFGRIADLGLLVWRDYEIWLQRNALADGIHHSLVTALLRWADIVHSGPKSGPPPYADSEDH